MTPPLRLAVIGCGRVFERFHHPALLRSADWTLVGAVDVRPMSRLGDYSTVGEPLRLESGQFLYTAPDDHVTQIGGIPMRAIQPLDRISPMITDLDITVPDPPNQSDRIVFITDSRVASQCSACPQQPIIAVNALQQAVLRLYGPDAAAGAPQLPRPAGRHIAA